MDSTKSTFVPHPVEKGNAILVNGELLKILKSALKKNARPIDKLPSDRDLIDAIVTQMTATFGGVSVYYSGQRNIDSCYKWFGSEVSKQISARDDLADKGRYVDACICAYLWGERGVRAHCVSSKVIRPRVMSSEERTKVATAAAAIADAKDVDSAFCPASLQIDI